jgi:hypothetical protein
VRSSIMGVASQEWVWLARNDKSVIDTLGSKVNLALILVRPWPDRLLRAPYSGIISMPYDASIPQPNPLLYLTMHMLLCYLRVISCGEVMSYLEMLHISSFNGF